MFNLEDHILENVANFWLSWVLQTKATTSTNELFVIRITNNVTNYEKYPNKL